MNSFYFSSLSHLPENEKEKMISDMIEDTVRPRYTQPLGAQTPQIFETSPFAPFGFESFRTMCTR